MKLLLFILWIVNTHKEGQLKIERVYSVRDASTFTLIVDNIHGPVFIEPSDNTNVYLTLEVKVSAAKEASLESAKKELKLGESKKGDSLILYVDAPFIKRCYGDYRGFSIHDHPDYSFKYSFKLKVPKKAAVEARTIDEGNILIKDIEGKIRANNVNGNVEIVNAFEVAGVGSVNGDVSINFMEQPKEAIKFNTVNGDFDLRFPNNFSAKIYFDSMNGDLYTAFDYRNVGPHIERSTEGGKFKIGTKTGVEIGSGGPEMSFTSVNGNVYLKKSND